MCEVLIVGIYEDGDRYDQLAEKIGLLPLLNGLMEPDPKDRQANLAAVSATGPWTPDEEPPSSDEELPSFKGLCVSDAGKPPRTRKPLMRDALPQGVPKPPLKSSPVCLFV